MTLTPADKAKELIETFAEIIPPVTYGSLQERNWGCAKQCALIAVDEILSVLKGNHIFNATNIEYFEEVKQEIENY